MRRRIHDDDVQSTFDLAHFFTANNFAEDAILRHDALDASLTGQLLCQLTDACGLQKVGEVLVQQCNVAHFSFLWNV